MMNTAPNSLEVEDSNAIQYSIGYMAVHVSIITQVFKHGFVHVLLSASAALLKRSDYTSRLIRLGQLSVCAQ